MKMKVNLSTIQIPTFLAVCIVNYTVLIVAKPAPETPLRGNLFKLNSNATSKLRSIYSNYAIPGTLIRANPRDPSNYETESPSSANKDYYDQGQPHINDKDAQFSFVRASYKPYVYEIEAVLLENDTKPEKPITYVYDFERDHNDRKNKTTSFKLNEIRNMSVPKGNRTVKDDDYLSINYTIRIDKNILQILSQVLTDFVQKIFKKTLMNYITQNMNHTMADLRDKQKIKTFFNYAIDLKTDPKPERAKFTYINSSSGNAGNNQDYQYFEKLSSSYGDESNNGFLVPYDDVEYDSNARRFQN